MSSVHQLPGDEQPPKPSSAVPVEQYLATAGWQPGRTCDLAKVEQALQQSGFRLHDAARHLLSEYHGLAVDVPVAGADGIVGFVHFDPEMVLRMFAPADLPRLAALIPRAACPVGTTSGHTMFVFLDEGWQELPAGQGVDPVRGVGRFTRRNRSSAVRRTQRSGR